MPRRKAIATVYEESSVQAAEPQGRASRIDALWNAYGERALALQRRVMTMAFAELAVRQAVGLEGLRACVAFWPVPQNQQMLMKLGIEAAVDAAGVAMQSQVEVVQACCEAIGISDPPPSAAPALAERRIRSVVIKFPDRRTKRAAA